MELCVIKGDGIGQEVIPAAVDVLRSVLPDLILHEAQAGWDCFQERGTSLPEETIQLASRCRSILFGAASSPHYPIKDYFSPIVRLRRLLSAYGNLRPTSYLPVPAAREGVDLVVVRENTEDLYIGNEQVQDDGESSTAIKLITRAASHRIAVMAYELARSSRRKRVTVVHKGNVMPHTDGLFRRVAFEVGKEYPDIATDELLVDTAAYWMVKEPTRFDVILTPNLYGDILSDMAAAWGGGLGLAPACNIGDDVCIAEPVHGSAPDIAGKGIANPTAAILSAALLVRYHWKLPEVAQRIEDAVHQTLSSDAYTADIRFERSLSTIEFTQQVIANL